MVKKITCEVQRVDRRADGTIKPWLSYHCPKIMNGEGVTAPTCGTWLENVPSSGVTKGLSGQCRDQHLVRSMEEHAARNFSVEELDKMQELGELERRMNYISSFKNKPVIWGIHALLWVTTISEASVIRRPQNQRWMKNVLLRILTGWEDILLLVRMGCGARK